MRGESGPSAFVAMQRRGRRLVAGEKAERLDVEDEIVGRALGPHARSAPWACRSGAGRPPPAETAARRSAAVLRRPAGGRIEAAAGDQALVGPGGGADQDVRVHWINIQLPTPCSTPIRFETLNPQQREAATHGTGDGAGDTRPAGHRRRGIGQDQHPGPPRRQPHPPRCRSAAPDAAHLQPPGRAGDGAPRRRRAAEGAGPARHAGAARAALEAAPSTIGARLLREYAAHRAGELHHPRPRRRRGPDGTGAPRDRLSDAKRFPLKGTCLGIYSRVLNTRDPLPLVLQSVYPWCAVGGRTEEAVRRLRGGQAAAERAGLRRPARLLGRHDGGARAGRGGRRALRPPAGRRVPGHQPAAGRDPARHEAERGGRHRGGRRRRASIPSGARRCATSWTSRRSSRSRRAWSRWSATTAAPRPSSMRATR